MAAPVNHWKLGFFVLLVVGATLVALIGIGERSAHHVTATFHSYFDESVSGLDSGAGVEFRGVGVGSVSSISIAPDHRHVDVGYDLDVDLLAKMGIAAIARDHSAQYEVPPDLRAQLGGNGLTGVKHVAIDVFDPRENPPPVLSFAVSPSYIPAATSTIKSLEDSLTKAADKVPALVDGVVKAAGHVDRVLAELEKGGVSDKATATLEHADKALAGLDGAIRRFDRERVPEKTSKALDDLRGLVASAQRATDAFGQVGRGASSSVRDFDQALDELRDAAEAIRVLAEDLDRDPDMLLKGRATRSAR